MTLQLSLQLVESTLVPISCQLLVLMDVANFEELAPVMVGRFGVRELGTVSLFATIEFITEY